MIAPSALALLAGLVVTAMAVWSAGAIYYSNLPWRTLRAGLAGVFVVATGTAFAVWPHPLHTLTGFPVVFGLLLMWWLAIPASNDGDWQPEVSVTPWAEIEGDRVTIHGVRNLGYRTETDCEPRWEDRTYDLGALDSVDLVAVYWAGRAVAHIMLSFGFGGKDYLAVSIETRRKRGQTYSTIAGFFRQYGLVYVVADERDVIRVRTTYRRPQEDVYLYRVRASIEQIRRVFLDYVRTMNELHARPRFYNTLTTNCTTGVLFHTRVNPGAAPLSWKVFLSGHVPEYAYELGLLDTTRPFPELERISRVNERALAADEDPEFSRCIREGLPVPPP